MNRALWAVLLLAVSACEPRPAVDPPPGVLKQALPQGPPGSLGLAPASGMAGDKFGHALAWGDFNGDQVPDLAVGAPGAANEDGRVYVYYGPLNPAAPVELSALITGNPGAGVGSALAAGDLNGDGVDDLVVGAPLWFDSTVGVIGRTMVVRGSRGVGLGNAYEALDPTALNLGARSLFGSVLVVRDGVLWVGGPGSTADAGSVTKYDPIFAGAALSATITLRGPPGFGAAILPLDIDGIGKGDLLVGSPLVSSGKGGVEVWFSSAAGGYDAGLGTLNTGLQAERFGSTLAVFEGRVAVGAPRATSGAGRVQLSMLSPYGMLTQLVSLPGMPSSQLGSTLATSDMDGDGTPELFAGAPASGTVLRYLSTPLISDRMLVETGGFGSALAGGVNALGDRAEELAVGAEDYVDLARQTYGGAVFVFFGDAGDPSSDIDGGSVDAGPPSVLDGGTSGVSISVEDLSGDTVTVRPISLSTSPGGSNTRFEWDFGDMTPLQVTLTPVALTHQYAAPGGYRVRLRLTTLGNEPPQTDDVQVKIPDRLGNQPPDALIRVLSTVEAGAQQTVKLECVSAQPSAPTQWDLGAGPLLTQNPVTATISAGSTRVHCYVQAANGLFAHDSVLLRHTALAPASCRLAFTPPAGPLPMLVVHSVDLPAALRPGATVTLEDSTVLAPDGVHPYDTRGFHPALLEAAGVGGIGRCTDRARAFTWEPLVLASRPSPLKCGEALNFTVEAPGADRVDLVSGTPGVTWDWGSRTVSGPRVLTTTRVGFTLKLASRFEEVAEDISLEVQCPPDLGEFSTCGCSAGGAAPLLLLLGLYGLSRRRRR